jgi:septum formation protein
MIHKLLHGKKVVLASASPRRAELFKLIGLSPLIIPALIHEPMTQEPPQRQVMKHALNKANAVACNMDRDAVIVGADTVVVFEGRIFGKPESKEQAAEFLRILSGQTHKVFTGVCVQWSSRTVCEYARSLVTFKTLTEEEIQSYLSTGEPFDKAGAYGIQGYGAQFVSNIRGCYFNVMGFPINLFYKMIQHITSDTR